MLHPPTTRFWPGKTNFYTLLLLSVSIFLSGCAALIVAGAGAGAYSYYAGNLVRTYNTNYHEAVRTSSKVMRQLKFTITGKTGDGLKTVLKGKRGDGTPVTIEVERVRSNQTKIGVRNGLVGISNQKASKQVHQHIGQNLQYQPVTNTDPLAAPIPQSQENNTKLMATDRTSTPVLPKDTSSMTVKGPGPDTSSYGTTAPVTPQLSRSTLYIYYRNNENTIPRSAYNTLDRVADYLSKNPGTSIDIRGYTDSKGDPGDNMKVSGKRAKAIGRYLKDKGIAAGRVTAKGYGASNFLASNSTENLRAMNRRVELRIK